MKPAKLSVTQFIFSLIFLLLLNFPNPAQKIENKIVKTDSFQYFGKPDKELTPDTKYIYGRLFQPVENLSKYKFTRPIEKNAVITVGAISDPRSRTGAEYNLLLVEIPQQVPYFCSDLNANGTIEENERLPSASANDSNTFEQILKLPLPNGFYKSFPVYLRFVRNYKNDNLKAGEKVVFQSVSAFASGAVTIGDKNVRVQYPFDATAPSISTTSGLFGIDADGDGQIKYEPFSSETSYAFDDELIFRLGNLYLSTRTIDLEKNQIIMRARTAAEYLKQDLEVGREMPDFTFIDFENKKRTLSEFRGKYLLVDFWGLWCVDCRRELPFQIEAYRRFRARGFEILAMDSDEMEKLAEVKEFLGKNRINWTQARYDSIKNLIEKTYRIQEYPSAILLAPDGKVLVLDQKQLTGDRVLATLDELLPL